VWVGIEVLRSTLFSGLPWLLLGYTQHDLFCTIQIVDLGGIWLLSLLVAFVNAALVHPSRVMKIAAAALLVVSALYGALRVPTIPLRDGPAIAVVQPNIPQELKKASRGDDKVAFENYEQHLRLTEQAAAGKPDLIVWPEAAIYKGVYVNLDGKPEWRDTRWYNRLMSPADETGIPLVSGLLIVNYWGSWEQEPLTRVEYTNSAVLVEPEKGIVGRYDKIHLVPFAEQYWIFKSLVQSISGLRLESMTPGKEVPVWDLGPWKFGAQICFEAIFPDISREIARKGAAFTVNISNDGWFKDSYELDQMLVMARFRSIENRIHVIRATNTGISAFIDPTGRVQATLESGGKVKEVEGVLAGRIRVTTASSVYRAVGDLVAWLALAGAVAALAGRILFERKIKST